MQLAKTIFQNSAIFIEKKWVENRLWVKVDFCGGKELIHQALRAAKVITLPDIRRLVKQDDARVALSVD